MIGRTLSHFEITASLGEGGMGEVYRATDRSLDREVAVKVLPQAFTSDAGRLARFRREAKALASLSHPNIATIYQVGRDGDVDFLVMELVPGETLAALLARQDLSTRQALAYALEIARALEAAHARGVAHRDLKPANVKVTPGGRVKLLDFGLAKAFTAEDDWELGDEMPTLDVHLTATGAVLGTTAYMSPEQVRGKSIDQRADIWAFGCVLWEMVAGIRPFQRGSDPDTLAAILRENVDLGMLPGDTPEGVRRLLDRCLRKPVDRRLHHIADARIELEEALERFHADEAPSGAAVVETPREPLSAPRAERPPQGAPVRGQGIRKVAAGVAAAASLAALAATVAYLAPTRGGRSSPDRSIAVLPFETLGPEEASVFTEGIHGDMLTRLSKVADLRVTSRSSVIPFRDAATPLPEIARQLRVTWILQGEVQQLGDQVQVNARLVDARQDRQVWAETYRRELTAENLFELQAELTREIVDQLAGRLSRDEERIVGLAPTADLEAYRLYVQGRALVEQRTELPQAVTYFRQAIERDPDYALAWAGLADALSLDWYYEHGSAPPEPILAEALTAARRAGQLAPDLAEVHASLGIVRSLRREGPQAVAELRRSVELNPSHAEGWAWLGWVENVLGRPERAREALQHAVDLSPLGPAYRAFLAEALLATDDYERALAEARLARQLQSDYAWGHYLEGLALFHLGRPLEARAPLTRALELALPTGVPSHAEIRAALALTHATASDHTAARELLAQIDAAVDPFAAGLIHASLGETDAAFALFDSVREWGFVSSPQVRSFFPTVLGQLRRRPGFDDILRRVDRSWGKLPPENRAD